MSVQLNRLVAKDARAAEWWSEGEDGYWVRLAAGYNFECCHQIQGHTVKEVLEDVEFIEKCEADCECGQGGK